MIFFFGRIDFVFPFHHNNSEFQPKKKKKTVKVNHIKIQATAKKDLITIIIEKKNCNTG